MFFYNVRCENKTVKESARLVLNEILPFWEKARIPTPDQRTCAAKVIKLYEEWRTVQKVCKSPFPSHRKKENDFKENLNNLFDIAHVDALKLISIQEDRDFLTKQRENGRVGSMTCVDQNVTNKEKRKAQRLEDEKRRKENYEEKKGTSGNYYVVFGRTVAIFFVHLISCTDLTMEHVEFESDESGDDVQAMDVKQTDNIPSCSNKPIRKRGKKNFIDDRMLACMDAGNMSSPLAIHFISATAKALGHNIEDLVLNCTSLREQRKKYRRRHGKEIIENFKVHFFILAKL